MGFCQQWQVVIAEGSQITFSLSREDSLSQHLQVSIKSTLITLQSVSVFIIGHLTRKKTFKRFVQLAL
jgi:hypothetical protein